MGYLSEELVPLALCDTGTSQTEKTAIVNVLIRFPRPDNLPPQKPKMRHDVLANHSRGEVSLDQFVGQRSWLMFNLLNLDTRWMDEPVEDWPEIPTYITFKHIVDCLKVVNDC